MKGHLDNSGTYGVHAALAATKGYEKCDCCVAGLYYSIQHFHRCRLPQYMGTEVLDFNGSTELVPTLSALALHAALLDVRSDGNCKVERRAFLQARLFLSLRPTALVLAPLSDQSGISERHQGVSPGRKS